MVHPLRLPRGGEGHHRIPQEELMIISRVWAMPSKHTFLVKPLREIINRYKKSGDVWVDPFAGFHSPAEITNDLNPDAPTRFHLDATQFLLQLPGPVDGVIFDPPYSLTQVARSYKGFGMVLDTKENPTGGFPKAKDCVSQLVRSGGFVISYGWNTVGMGKKRGFVPIEYLICSHGGNRNDTLVTVERKL